VLIRSGGIGTILAVHVDHGLPGLGGAAAVRGARVGAPERPSMAPATTRVVGMGARRVPLFGVDAGSRRRLRSIDWTPASVSRCWRWSKALRLRRSARPRSTATLALGFADGSIRVGSDPGSRRATRSRGSARSRCAALEAGWPAALGSRGGGTQQPAAIPRVATADRARRPPADRSTGRSSGSIKCRLGKAAPLRPTDAEQPVLYRVTERRNLLTGAVVRSLAKGVLPYRSRGRARIPSRRLISAGRWLGVPGLAQGELVRFDRAISTPWPVARRARSGAPSPVTSSPRSSPGSGADAWSPATHRGRLLAWFPDQAGPGSTVDGATWSRRTAASGRRSRIGAVDLAAQSHDAGGRRTDACGSTTSPARRRLAELGHRRPPSSPWRSRPGRRPAGGAPPPEPCCGAWIWDTAEATSRPCFGRSGRGYAACSTSAVPSLLTTGKVGFSHIVRNRGGAMIGPAGLSGKAGAMTLPLICPNDRTPFRKSKSGFSCAECGRQYPIQDGSGMHLDQPQ